MEAGRHFRVRFRITRTLRLSPKGRQSALEVGTEFEREFACLDHGHPLGRQAVPEFVEEQGSVLLFEIGHRLNSRE